MKKHTAPRGTALVEELKEKQGSMMKAAETEKVRVAIGVERVSLVEELL